MGSRDDASSYGKEGKHGGCERGHILEAEVWFLGAKRTKGENCLNQRSSFLAYFGREFI
jgi:hypothetical protein